MIVFASYNHLLASKGYYCGSHPEFQAAKACRQAQDRSFERDTRTRSILAQAATVPTDGGWHVEDIALCLVCFLRGSRYRESNLLRLTLPQAIMILYFVSSSSIPKPEIPGGSNFDRWKGKKDKNNASTGKSPSVPPSSQELGLAAEAVSSKPSLSSGLGAGAKMNATFVSLTRNSDLWDIADSIRNVEDRFNRNYHYDWVFLNDKPFDDTFKKVTTALVSGTARYGLIGKEHWSFPSFIDQDKAKAVREDMAERKIIYGDSISYRHMCRFESGFFFRQPLMNEYEWYWRVEPSIKLYCDIGFDPFVFMAENKKIYSFVISLFEYAETIPTIWDSAKKFMKLYPEHIPEDNAMDWLSDDDGETYNHCHFVSFLCRAPKDSLD